MTDPQSFNPRVNFGQFKNSDPPTHLQDLDEGYLRHIAKPMADTGGSFFFKGLDWGSLARQELRRRNGGPPVSLNTEIEIPTVLDGEDLTQPPKKLPRQFDLSIGAVDDAADFLLREFITRRNKAVRFQDWIKELGQEAMRCGTKLPISAGQHGEVNHFSYLKKSFVIKTTETEHFLQQIIPHKDES